MSSRQPHPANDPQVIDLAVKIPEVQSRLQAHDREMFTPGPNTRQAAVAIILYPEAEPAAGTRMLFIKRAEKPGDPWSGHMAFPGGHLETDDADLAAAAARETFEEIGLDLASHGQYLGAVDQQRANPRGRQLDMLIEPHVFQLNHIPPMAPNYEVADIVWADMQTLMHNSLHDTEVKPMAGTPTTFNGYRLSNEHFVWGLTYRMLKSFFTLLVPQWQPPAEID